MTLPEHELNRRCEHGTVVDICPDEQCQTELSEMEDAAQAEREEWNAHLDAVAEWEAAN